MVRTRLRSSDTWVVLAAAVAVAASIPFLHIPNGRIFLAFALLVSASEMFEVTLPSGMPFTLGLAPALGFALYGVNGIPESIAAAAAGFAAATIVRALLPNESLRLTESSEHLLTLAGATTIHVALRNAGLGFPQDGAQSLNLGALLLTSAAILVVVVSIATTLQSVRRAHTAQIPLAPVFIGTLRSTSALHVAIFSVGALLALSYPALENWAFPLFLAPLYATQYAYRQFAQIKKTYLQTIRALSKVPEMAGYSAKGHSQRVAEYSVAIAREMAVPEDEISEIEYAALMHDIGRISLQEPEDEAEPDELAAVGASIVRQTGHFPQVADMIERQHLSYRRRGEDTDQHLSIGSRAIKVASAYDDLTKRRELGLSPRDALDKLYLGMAFDFDPDVIKALTRVLEKSGVI